MALAAEDEKNKAQRVFFALWPTPANAEKLHRHALAQHARCGGQVMEEDALHMTLIFVGSTPAERLDALSAAAGKVRCETFGMTLDTVAHWHHNGILWAGLTKPPQTLLRLAEALSGALRTAGVPFDEKAFKPHVTLLRKTAQTLPAQTIKPITWQVDEFALMMSERDASGARYRKLVAWSLQ